MKKLFFSLILSIFFITSYAQQQNSNNTLLWKISGKKLTKPTYIFGTIHMLCADDIELSANLRSAIKQADKIYLELDMDNMFEMLSVLGKMKMRNDTTLSDLLTANEYDKVKSFFKTHGSVLPFSVLETYKPMLTASTLMQASLDCEHTVAMEQLIMKEAKSIGKGIKGLETMAYQMSIFDSIPYGLQAKQLVSYVDSFDKKNDNKEFEELTSAYRNQQLDKLEELTQKDDAGMTGFSDILLFNRNKNWAKKLDEMMPKGSIVVAVGAGHLPGEKGLLKLLEKAGYKVEPVKNEMLKQPKQREM